MIPHVFAPDSSATDRPGKAVECIHCQLPERNKIHTTAMAEDLSARIVGEAEGRAWV